jgi:hypothetical protein
MPRQLIKVETLCGKCGTLTIDGVECENEYQDHCEHCGSNEIVVYVHTRRVGNERRGTYN